MGLLASAWVLASRDVIERLSWASSGNSSHSCQFALPPFKALYVNCLAAGVMGVLAVHEGIRAGISCPVLVGLY